MNYVVSIPLDPNLAEFIGKKGSENSITFYNRKLGEHVIVGLAPTSVDEKFYAVAESMLIAGQIVVSTLVLDKLFGEILVACSLLEKHIIFTKDNDIKQFLGRVVRKNYAFMDRSALLEGIVGNAPKEQGGEVRIDIDKAFPVKGQGTIALGIITKGSVKVHDELFHSSGKKVMIRSIQSQDVDIDGAEPGTRVGLALKGIEHDEVGKGDLLSSKAILRTASMTGNVVQSSIAREDIVEQKMYEFVCNFGRSFASVTSFMNGKIAMKLEKPLPIAAGDEFLLIREKQPRIFAGGRVA